MSEEHKHTVEEESPGFPDLEDFQEPEQAKKTTAELDAEWLKNTYKGDVPQLTARAVVMGALLGGFMSLSNLYVGLKTGWGLGVAITACILAFAITKVLRAVGAFKTDMTILENNVMQTAASSAGYSTGGTMVSAISAYLLITGTHMSWQVLGTWTLFLAALGVMMAIPMKRQMINAEQLRFPSGLACAETLKSLHAEGVEGMKKAKALACSGVLGAVVAWCRDAGIPKFIQIPGHLPFGKLTLGGFALTKWTIHFDMSAIMIAAGAIMGWKVCWSLLLGACINYGILAPWAVKIGAIPIAPDGADLGYRAIVRWSTWAGAAIMVSSALFSFALQWRSILTVFSGFAATLGLGQKKSETDPMEAIEVPNSWFLWGTVISGLGCMAVLQYSFHTRWWMSIIAIVMTFFLGVVACRVTGETDTTPIGAMGKITQLLFGVLAPGNHVTNLMTAGVTAGAAGSSADLLTGLKTGYLLGANPRKQFLAQFFGIFAGTLIVVPAFYILVPNASALGSDQWPAPSAQVWAAVARLLSEGFQALHPTARFGLFIGLGVGLLIPALELAFPKARPYIPSATGIGLAMVIPFFNSLSMFIGALITLYMEKKHAKIADDYIVTAASGVIAGESLLGVFIAILAASGVIG
ncbi:MAG: OPT/YSL family transporter [Elusimicrobia bacterium]|nr:OPT/YSL family transporter [Elusimicrobiota bacterium]